VVRYRLNPGGNRDARAGRFTWWRSTACSATPERRSTWQGAPPSGLFDAFARGRRDGEHGDPRGGDGELRRGRHALAPPGHADARRPRCSVAGEEVGA
jgi:hypothetical protein